MRPAADLPGHAARRVRIPAVPGEAGQQQLLGEDIRNRARPLPLFGRALPHLPRPVVAAYRARAHAETGSPRHR